MPQYQFVVSDGRPRPASRYVRSHAIRTALHKKATQDDEQDLATNRLQLARARRMEELKDGLTGRFRIAPKSEHVVQDQLRQLRFAPSDAFGRMSPSQLKDDGFIDPFGTLCVPNTPQVDALIKYFLTAFKLNMATKQMQRRWFAFSMNEPLMMHTMLALVAISWLCRAPGAGPRMRQEVLHQKLQAIKIVNSLLGSSDDNATLIIGVANLAEVATTEGSFDEADMHMQALKRLVKQQGKNTDPLNNPFVARAVTWADLQTAAGLGRAPLFPLFYDRRRLELPQSLLDDAELPSLKLIEDLGTGADHVTKCFILLRKSMLSCARRAAPPEIVMVHMNIAETAILNQIFDDTRTEPFKAPLMSLLLAAHLFLYIVMRQVAKNSAIARTLRSRLMDSLWSTQDSLDNWEHHLPALLWVLFVAAIATDKSRSPTSDVEDDWIMLQLRCVCQMMRLTTNASLAEALSGFLWIEATCVPQLLDLLDLELVIGEDEGP